MKLLNLEPLKPDEMLYSWLHRIADINAMSYETFTKEILKKSLYVAPEIGCYMPGLLYKLGYQEDSREFFIKSSLYSYFSMNMTNELQGKYLASFFMPRSSFLGNMTLLITDFSVCPQCLEEDKEKYGRPYLHRSHQLGVFCCPIHKTKLYNAKFQQVNRFTFDLSHYTSFVDEITDFHYEYAIFAQKLLGLKHSLNLFKLKEILRQRCQKNNMFTSKKKLWSSLKLSESKYSSLLVLESIARDLRMFSSCKGSSMQFLQSLIMYVYDGKFDEFAADVAQYEEHQQVFPNKKELAAYGISEISPPLYGISVFRHDCGKHFLQNRWGAKVIGCPYCNCQEPVPQRIRNIALRSGNGDYELLDSPGSFTDVIRIKHKRCGRIYTKRFDRFVFNDAKCSCRTKLSIKKVSERIKKCGSFELIKFSDTMHKAVIRHNDCGRSFEIMLHKFLKSPYCRLCDRVIMNNATFFRQVDELTDGEFKVMSDYTGADNRISIMHKVCGKTHDYLPYIFLRNCRCAECDRNLSFERTKKLVEKGTSGRYTLKHYNHRGACFLLDKASNREIKTRVSEIYFELVQSKRSSLIELNDAEEKIRQELLEELRNAPKLLIDEFLLYLRNSFEGRVYFRTDEIIFKKTSHESIRQMLCILKKRGYIESMGFAMYRIVGRGD